MFFEIIYQTLATTHTTIARTMEHESCISPTPHLEEVTSTRQQWASRTIGVLQQLTLILYLGITVIAGSSQKSLPRVLDLFEIILQSIVHSFRELLELLVVRGGAAIIATLQASWGSNRYRLRLVITLELNPGRWQGNSYPRPSSATIQ